MSGKWACSDCAEQLGLTPEGRADYQGRGLCETGGHVTKAGDVMHWYEEIDATTITVPIAAPAAVSKSVQLALI